MFDGKILASNIKSFRKLKGLTQTDLADRLYIRAQSISKWEKGDALPGVENLYALSEILGVSVDELIGKDSADSDWLIGVDGGGTKTEFILFNSLGKIIKRIVLGGCNPNLCGADGAYSILKSGLDELLRVKPATKGIYVGAAGFGTGNYAEVITKKLKQLYPKVEIKCTSDMFNAVASVTEERCICSICGTGSIVFYYDKGEIIRIGGYGAYIDEMGSGYHIGKQALLVSLEERDNLRESSLITAMVEGAIGGKVLDKLQEIYSKDSAYIASFAPIVIEAYKQGDKTAEEILDNNAKRLAFLINSLHKRLNLTNKLALVGGLNKDETFYKFLKQNLNNELEPVLSDLPPVYGACVLCCALTGTSTESLKQNFSKEYSEQL